MAEFDMSNLPGNHQSEPSALKDEPEPPKKERASLVAKPATKRPIFSKFFKGGASQDAKDIGAYVVEDIILPSIRDLVFAVITQGATKAIYGDAKPPKRMSGYTQYSSATRVTRLGDDRAGFNVSERRQSAYQSMNRAYEDLRFDDYLDAQNILDHMNDYLDTYKAISVADLYDMCGITPTYQDNTYGWESLGTARVEFVRGNQYRLHLPRPKKLSVR